MDAGTLHAAIAEVCPVISVTVGNPNDRATWTFIPGAGATQPQIAAGNNVIATIPIDALSQIAPGDLIARFTNAEYNALLTQQKADLAAGVIGNVKNWDTMMGTATVNMNDRRVKAIKNNLVSSGVLTQARADVIFA